MATPESIALAAELLRQKEGLRSKPYWDVNALRAGYGSDTTTLADGTVKRITKDTVVSKEDAERDLARRVTDFANIAQKEIGANFSNLTPQAQAAITSVAYNYGTTKKVAGLVKAAQAGDNTAIAKAIAGAAGHNNGVNRQRRLDEAAIVLGKKQLTPNALTIDSVAGYNGASNVPNPQSQLGDVKSYNSQMVQAAQKIADNNLAAVNNFGWNPTVEGSQAQNFGKAVQRNTDAITSTDQELLNRISRYDKDGNKKGLGQYIFDRTIGQAGETITQQALQAMQREQSITGDSLAKQVANMKATLDGTVINPAVLDKAAGNLTQQQQAENQTYNVVTDNANAQQRYELDKSNSEVANRLNTERAAREQAEFEATQAAKRKAIEQQAALQPAIQEAATAMGLSIPQGMSYNDAVALVPEPQRTEFVTRIANQNRAANSLYDAVIVGQSPYATDAQRRVAAGGESLVRSILSTEGAQQAINAEPTAEGKERVRRALVQDALDRASFGEAASKEFSTVANNPYSLTNRGEEFFKDIPPLKGVTNPADFRDVFATILRSSDAGATSAEIASTLSAISNKLNATNKANGLPLPPARLHVKYLSNVYDVTKPVDVAKLRHAMGREEGDKDSITGFIRRRIAEGAGLVDSLTPFFAPNTTNTSDQRSRKEFGKIPQ